MSSRYALRLGAVVFVAGALAGLGVGRVAHSDGPGVVFASEPRGSARIHEIRVAGDPVELMVSADLVVVATVEGAHPGKTRGELAEEQIVDRLVDLRIEEVVFAAPAMSKVEHDSLQVLEGYWEVDGEGFVVNDVRWSHPGATGIYFLHLMDGEKTFRPVDSYGRLLFDDPRVPDGPSGVQPEDAGAWAGTPIRDLADLRTAQTLVEEIIDQLQQ